jgi:transposase-like protein
MSCMMNTGRSVSIQDNLTTKGNFPHTYREFVQEFPGDDACGVYLERLGWPGDFSCPACQTIGVPWRQTRGRLVCSACRHQTSVTTGTILEKTRTPLTTWFEAAWHLTTAKNGLSAKTLERTLGTSYRTAWAMLQRFRVAMVRSERERLSRVVEVDETLVGGVERGGKRGRGTSKPIVVIAIEVKENKGFGRVRMRHVPDASGVNLQPFICDVVAQGANVRTDGWIGYNGLSRHGYIHDRVLLSSSGDPAHVSMPGVHRVASLLKRWILGTHQGSVVPAHLQSYLEEFTFRFNRRNSRSRGLVFSRLMEQCVVIGPITEAEVTFGYDWGRNRARRS